MTCELKNRINSHLFKSSDLYSNLEYNREILIDEVFKLYKIYCSEYLKEPDEYLNYLNNDILSLIGYKETLEKNNDSEGVSLWEDIDRLMQDENNNIISDKIKLLLQEVPLYFLMSLLSIIYCFITISEIETNENKDEIENNENI